MSMFQFYPPALHPANVAAEAASLNIRLGPIHQSCTTLHNAYQNIEGYCKVKHQLDIVETVYKWRAIKNDTDNLPGCVRNFEKLVRQQLRATPGNEGL